jgi:hypothetical protein
MMEEKMADQKAGVPRNQAMKVMTLASLGLLAILLLARFAGILPIASDMTPTVAVAFCTVMTLAIFCAFDWYLRRTDEHDLHANLWSMAWAWISGALITIDWSILHIAKVAPPVDAMIILITSSAVAAVAWAWLRFR